MKLLLVFICLVGSLFSKDFYFKDGTKLKIENTSYGILVDGTYKLSYTNQEHISNGEYADIYQNNAYTYSIFCEDWLCAVKIINKYTNEVKYASDNYSKPITHRIVIFKNGIFFNYHTQFTNLEDCKKQITDYNNREDLKNRGFLYNCESIK
jgi:hypothetical protein